MAALGGPGRNDEASWLHADGTLSFLLRGQVCWQGVDDLDDVFPSNYRSGVIQVV